MSRLVPPWQPMTVVAETESLADGRAVLGLPGGLRWVAQHDRPSFDPPHRFVDELSSAGPRSWPPAVIGWWRHTHDFSRGGRGGTTRCTTSVDTPVPAAALRLDVRLPAPPARRRSGRAPRCRRRGSAPMVVAVTGASGLVGSALTALLTHRRSPGDPAGPTARRATKDERQWDPDAPAPDLLSGSTPSCTWPVRRSPAGSPTRTRPRSATAASSRRAGSPRPRPTATAARRSSSALRRSAIYGFDRGDALLCEDSVRGDGFLADVVADWEAATGPAADGGPAGGRRAHRNRAGRARAARCGCCGRCSRQAWAAGSAAAGSGCPGSASTTCSTSTTARSTTTG